VAVTHDQTEAMALSDRVAIMRDGRIEQVATPTDAYGEPATRFVATFLGEANLVPPDLPLVAAAPRTTSSAAGAALLRPEQILLDAGGDRHATVREAVFQDERWQLVVEYDGLRLIVSRPSTAPRLAAGDAVAVAVTGKVHVVPNDATGSPTEHEAALSPSRGVIVGR
jgi:putative spermidine/putrescine transport system ATP-binding protein